MTTATTSSGTRERDFLLRRLMRDAQILRDEKSPTDEEANFPTARNGSSSSTTADDTDNEHSEENEGRPTEPFDMRNKRAPTTPRKMENANQPPASVNLQMFNSSLQQYAATLAAAHLMQQQMAVAAAAAATNPNGPSLLEQYPLIYRNLLANACPNVNGPAGIFPAIFQHYQGGRGAPEAKPETTLEPKKLSPVASTPDKRMASISLASPQSNGSRSLASSPRKRAPRDPMGVATGAKSPATPKKARAIRRIQFDDEKCSPVSGMYIKDMDEICVPSANGNGDELKPHLLDDSARWVQVTEEAKAELAKIPNVIGDYVCRLCKVCYNDAFQLAKHKCPRIAHQEYRCPECNKVFNCPANLASHRRWHKPKDADNGPKKSNGSAGADTDTLSKKSASPVLGDEERILDEQQPIDLSGHTSADRQPLQDQQLDAEDGESDSERCTPVSQVVVPTMMFYECETCGKRFDAHRWLRIHALTHSNFGKKYNEDQGEQFELCEYGEEDAEEADEYQCAETSCRLWFLSRDALEKHSKRAHPKFVCKFCNENFATSPALTRHINRNHPASIEECRVVLLSQCQ